jgi:hypothetical protein
MVGQDGMMLMIIDVVEISPVSLLNKAQQPEQHRWHA